MGTPVRVRCTREAAPGAVRAHGCEANSEHGPRLRGSYRASPEHTRPSPLSRHPNPTRPSPLSRHPNPTISPTTLQAARGVVGCRYSGDDEAAPGAHPIPPPTPIPRRARTPGRVIARMSPVRGARTERPPSSDTRPPRTAAALTTPTPPLHPTEAQRSPRAASPRPPDIAIISSNAPTRPNERRSYS